MGIAKTLTKIGLFKGKSLITARYTRTLLVESNVVDSNVLRPFLLFVLLLLVVLLPSRPLLVLEAVLVSTVSPYTVVANMPFLRHPHGEFIMARSFAHGPMDVPLSWQVFTCAVLRFCSL